MKKLLLICFLVSLNSFSQATLVEDINLGNGSSSPSNKIVFNNEAYFVADNGVNGKELWKTDGTFLGTVLVKDLISGIDNSFTGELKAHVVGGELLFFEQTAFNEHKLWKTDGTTMGTVLVKDVPNGNLLVHSDLNNELLFSIDNELWKTDGTDMGTVMVKDVAIFGNRYIKSGSAIYFSGSSYGSIGYELWKTDGTTVGTVLVKDIQSGTGNSFPNYFGQVGSDIFFTANDGTNGQEIWKSDGTEMGTVMVKNLTAGNGSTFVNYFAVYNNEYFFNKSGDTKLYKSDGTDIGTIEVKDVGFIKDIIAFNSKLYVFNFDTTFWESDGTTVGTNQITTKVDEFFHNSEYEVIGNELYFQGRDDCFYQLWKTDGTALGTIRIKVIMPTWDDGHIQYITNLNGTVLLTANDGTWHGNELWKSNGTEVGTTMIKDINQTGNQWSNPQEFYDFDGMLLFNADNGINGRELWKSDGTTTTMVKDISPGNLFGDPKEFVNYNGEVYFKATTKTHGTELWKTDGTESGTVRITDINANEESSLLSNGNIVVLNNKLYFYANDGTDGAELWESDGTALGTSQVKDINVGIEDSSSNGILFLYNNAIYFTAHDGTFDYELYKSDGTQAGTNLLKDLYPTGSSNTSNFTLFNNKFYFTANTASGGRLWVSDGTDIGTTIVSASASYPSNLVVSGSNLFFTSGNDLWKTDGVSTTAMAIGGYPGYLTNHSGVLYFRTNVGGLGYELWKTDGTNSNMVKDIVPGSNQSSNITEIVSYGNNIYFGAGDNSQNKELWISDGTELGTVLFQDINPSVEMFGNGSDPNNFFVLGNTLYFAANDGATNVEPWKLVDGSLSDEVFTLDNELKLYPNPVRDVFQVKSKSSNLQSVNIYSLLGKNVKVFTVEDVRNNQFNISSLTTGIYIAKVKTNLGEKSIKLIKQ